VSERYLGPGRGVADDKASSFGAPLLLGTSVTLTAPGETAIPKVAHLQNPFRTSTLIDEVRFTIKSMVTSEPATGMGGIIHAKFALGRIALSEKFVPIWNYGTLFTTHLENEVAQQEGQFATYCTFSHYRWILPKPLFVPEGNQLVPTFLRDPTMGTDAGTVTVNVAYAGRALQPGARIPTKLNVPFVGYFEHPSTSEYSQSDAKDLYNPFQVPLRIQRLVGRVLTGTFDGVTAGVISPIAPQLKIIDSNGYSIVDNSSANYTPFNAIFDAQRRAWTYNRALKAKEWITVQSRFPGGATVRLQISAVGYREEVA